MIDAKAVATNPADRNAQRKLRDSTRKVWLIVVSLYKCALGHVKVSLSCVPEACIRETDT